MKPSGPPAQNRSPGERPAPGWMPTRSPARNWTLDERVTCERTGGGRLPWKRTARSRAAGTRLALPVVALALLGGACSDDGGSGDDPISASDLVTVVDAAPLEAAMVQGERLGIRFPGSASIGDDWVLLESSDEKVAEVVAENVTVDDPDADGSGGTVTFVVEGTSPGFTRLSFVNCFQGACTQEDLPSESDIDDRDLVVIDVAVRVTAS